MTIDIGPILLFILIIYAGIYARKLDKLKDEQIDLWRKHSIKTEHELREIAKELQQHEVDKQ